VFRAADENAAAQKRPDRQDNCFRVEPETLAGHNAGNPIARDDQVLYRLLEQGQAGLVLQHTAYGLAIELSVRLRPGRPDGGALARIQRAKLYPGLIDRPRHRAAHCIDFPRQVSLADPADGRIATHLPKRSDVLRNKKRARTGPRGSECRFRSGVAAANHNDIDFGIHDTGQKLSNTRRAILMRGRTRRHNALLNFVELGR
jgi:hypothetical protein